MVRVCLICPAPLQVVQGSVMMVPLPRQVPQVFETLKKPCWNLIWPVPLQLEQATGCLPSFDPEPRHEEQLSHLGILIFFSVPKADSSRLISRSYRRSLPLAGRCLR
jgi:hypothetical protein